MPLEENRDKDRGKDSHGKVEGTWTLHLKAKEHKHGQWPAETRTEASSLPMSLGGSLVLSHLDFRTMRECICVPLSHLDYRFVCLFYASFRNEYIVHLRGASCYSEKSLS